MQTSESTYETQSVELRSVGNGCQIRDRPMKRGLLGYVASKTDASTSSYEGVQCLHVFFT